MEFEKRRARERSDANLKRGDAPTAPTGALGESEGRVTEKLAEKSGVGRRTIERAIKVREEGMVAASWGNPWGNSQKNGVFLPFKFMHLHQFLGARSHHENQGLTAMQALSLFRPV